jgi:hypothetical protein
LTFASKKSDGRISRGVGVSFHNSSHKQPGGRGCPDSFFQLFTVQAVLYQQTETISVDKLNGHEIANSYIDDTPIAAAAGPVILGEKIYLPASTGFLFFRS